MKRRKKSEKKGKKNRNEDRIFWPTITTSGKDTTVSLKRVLCLFSALLICLLHTYYLRPSRTTSFLCMLYAAANQVRPRGPRGPRAEKYLLHYKDLKILNACVGIQNERQPALWYVVVRVQQKPEKERESIITAQDTILFLAGRHHVPTE